MCGEGKEGLVGVWEEVGQNAMYFASPGRCYPLPAGWQGTHS